MKSSACNVPKLSGDQDSPVAIRPQRFQLLRMDLRRLVSESQE